MLLLYANTALYKNILWAIVSYGFEVSNG
jgi:hypothetical protein